MHTELVQMIAAIKREPRTQCVTFAFSSNAVSASIEFLVPVAQSALCLKDKSQNAEREIYCVFNFLEIISNNNFKS